MTKRIELSIFYFLLFLLSSSCEKRGENSIYLIPDNFEGNVLIIFDQIEGANMAFENESRLYVLDTSGVLRTKFKQNFGLQRMQFFYINSAGQRKTIPYSQFVKSKVTDSVYCYNIETGKSFNAKVGKDEYHEFFTIAKESHVDSIIKGRSFFIWNTLEE